MTLTARTGELCERLPSTVVNAADGLQEVIAQIISSQQSSACMSFAVRYWYSVPPARAALEVDRAAITCGNVWWSVSCGEHRDMNACSNLCSGAPRRMLAICMPFQPALHQR